jgi:lysophospholipase
MTTNWTLSQESELDYSDTSVLTQFWQNDVSTDIFQGEGNVPVAYCYAFPEMPKGAIVLSSGRVETYLKYREVIFDFYNNGFAVFALDHRGQGLSGRMTQDPQHGFVAHFDDYVKDMKTFVDSIVREHWQGQLNLVCHSMGGAIGALTLLAESELFAKAVLCSPMFGIKPALPNWLANTLISAGLKKTQLRKKDSDYFFGQKPYFAYPFQVNPLTRSKKRYEFMLDLYARFPELQLGGVTTEWLAAAQVAMNTIEFNAKNINTPTLTLSSGRDIIIDNKRQARVARQFANATYHVVEGAMHELFCEKDQYRLDAMQRILDFLNE